MTIKHRIERLESRQLPANHPRYVILSVYGETEDEAKRRYCAEKEISMDELEEPGVIVNLVRLCKPGNTKNAV